MANSKWVMKAKRADFEGIGKKYNIDQVTARLMVNRGITTDEEIRQYLYGTMDDLIDGGLMKDAIKGANIIKQAIGEKEPMRIIGDYDIDGVTSTYILIQGITRCGGQVDRTIPHRVKDGYGLNENLIQQAHKDGIKLIITCDNGIAAIDAVALAKSYSMTVVVTDHHQIPYDISDEGEKVYKIPLADAIINPHQLDCAYPFKTICGAMVAYKVMEVLYRLCQIPEDQLQLLVPYAAIGTVGDIMPLQGENRILVKEGLKQINQRPDVGLEALISNCGLEQEEIKAYHIGFIIGPCINASGRLESAEEALEVLLCRDKKQADILAKKLVSLNEIRKDMTAQYVDRAIELIESNGWDKDRVMVVYLPECHESIAGIIAGRIKEKYYRPVFVLTKVEDGVKGSGRSIENYNMFQEMVKVGYHFNKYGGHAMAAGCSLDLDQVGPLREDLNQQCSLKEEDLYEKVSIDIPMPMGYVSEQLIEEFEILEPFGNKNAKPVFAQKDLEIIEAREIGNHKQYLKLKVKSVDGRIIEGISFSDPKELFDQVEKQYGIEMVLRLKRNVSTNLKIMVTYYPSVNEYNGRRSLQMKISKYRIQ